MTTPQRKLRRAPGEKGFTVLQLLIVVALIVIISVFAFSQIAQARDNMRLAGAASELAMRMEKARLDSIRRHANPGQLATLTFTAANTYTVSMDFDYTGTPFVRTFRLPDGVTLWPTDNIPAAIDFDWRGRTNNDVRLTLRNARGTTRAVELTRNGEIAIDRTPFNAQAGQITNVTPGTDINTDILQGAGAGAGNANGGTGAHGGNNNTGTGNTNGGYSGSGNNNTATGNTNSGGTTTGNNTNSGGTTTGTNTNSGGTTSGGNTNSGGTTTGGNTNSGGTTGGAVTVCGTNDRPATTGCVCPTGYSVDPGTGKCIRN